MVRNGILAFLFASTVLLSMTPSASSARPSGTDDVNAVSLNVLSYHPTPDPNADPWGVPAMVRNGTAVDWMVGFYGAFFFPTAVFDGVVKVESTNQGVGAGAFQETDNNYRAVVEERLKHDAPLTIRLDAQVNADTIDVNATLTPKQALGEPGLVARVVLFEDDVAYNGGNGVVNHRFVVRWLNDSLPVDFSAGVPVNVKTSIALQAGWDLPRLGLVLYVQNTNPDSKVFDDDEIAQAATWTVRQEGPTVQASKGVLLEMYSATWCAACIYGDSAQDNLANEYGVLSTRIDDSRFEYLGPVPWLAVAASVIVGLGAVWILARRAGTGGGPNGP